jgi:hypothetical protein
MRKTLVGFLGMCLVLWTADAEAGSRWPSVREAPADAPLAEDRAERFTGSLLNPDLEYSAESDRAAGRDSSRDIAAIIVAVFVGFGIGHMIVGDVPRGLMFLGIELGVVVVAIAISVIIFATASSGATVSPGLFIIFPLAGLAMLGIRIWEVVDLVFRTGVTESRTDARAAVITVDRRWSGDPHGVQPAFANVFNRRF